MYARFTKLRTPRHKTLTKNDVYKNCIRLYHIEKSLTLSQCTLAGPVYTGMPLVDPVYTGIPLEKLSWNSPTLESHLRNLFESAPHWDATGETLTSAAYTGTPLEGLWQPTHAPTHIVKHAEYHPRQFEMTRWRDTSKQVDRSLLFQPLLGVYCSAMDASSALNTCDYSVHAFDMSTIIVFVYLGLQIKWNQFSTNNSHHSSCIL